MLSLPPCCFFSTRNLTFSSQEGSFKWPSNPLLKKTPKTIYFDIISDTKIIANIVQKTIYSLYPDYPNVNIVHLLYFSLYIHIMCMIYCTSDLFKGRLQTYHPFKPMINNLPPFSQVWLLTVFKPHSLFPLWTSWWESLILLPLVPSGDSNHESPTYIGETSVWPHPLSHSENPEPALLDLLGKLALLSQNISIM